MSVQQPANDNTSGAEPGPAARSERPCPICGKPGTVHMRPFCSKRCADIDLHRWLGGSYAVPASDSDDADVSSDDHG